MLPLSRGTGPRGTVPSALQPREILAILAESRIAPLIITPCHQVGIDNQQAKDGIKHVIDVTFACKHSRGVRYEFGVHR